MKILTPLFVSLIILSFSISCGPSSEKGISQQGNTEKNISALNENIKKNPKDPNLYVKRADYFLGNELVNEALSDVKKALELEPKNRQANITLSSIYLLMGKPQQALEVLNNVIAFDPSCTDAYLKKAKLCLVMKDYENCAKAVQSVFKLDPHNADAYYLKGVALDENNEPIKAVEAFQQAALYNPRHFEALMQLGYANSKSNPNMAIDYFNNALKALPGSTEAMYNLGLLYQENEQPQKALDVYSEMLKINPRNKLALYNSGYVNMVYLTKYAVGYDFFTKAMEVDSTYTDAIYNRGYCSELLGRYMEARKDYTRVLEMKINDNKAVKGLNRLDKLQKR